MEKQVQFFGQTEAGIFCQSLFGSAGAFEKTAGAPPFADWATGDALRRYISGITRDDRKKYCYVLVNALGAGEYFGSNINADYFPWNALCHEGDDYGYRTFLSAHAFQHHKNKDPTRAFGIPVLSTLNGPMKRVELIIRLDREKAKVEGADGIITRIDNGEFPDVSMGCRVPFDVCSKCGHRSKTKEDYCVHMKPPEELRHIYGPNKILADGSKIYVINLHPRFFDISFVFIGADKTAKVMAKVAQVGNQICLGDVCAIPRPSAEVYELTSSGLYVPEGTEKVASACSCDCGGKCGEDPLVSAFTKTSSVVARPKRKLAEIVKEVPTGTFAMRQLPKLEQSEPDLPRDMLDHLSEQRLPKVLGALGTMGVVLKPHEYARVVLRRMGEEHLADEMDGCLMTPRPVREFGDSPVEMDEVLGAINDLVRALSPRLQQVVERRGALGAPFILRVKVRMDPKNPLPTRTPVEHPLLDKISAAYNGYRRSFLQKLGQATELVQRDPQLREMVLGETLVNIFSKTASSVPVLSLDSVTYLMGAYLADRGLLSNTAGAVCNDWLLDEEPSAQGF